MNTLRPKLVPLLLAACAVPLLAACGSSGDDSSDSATAGGTTATSSEPITIGIAAAKTGGFAPYDLQAGQLFEMGIKEANAKGGVLGRQVKVKWIDTKSDKQAGATNAKELIAGDADLLVASCDFDYSLPALQVAQAAKIPGLSLCASSPKSATPGIVGAQAGSMGQGSDTEGVAMAEWLRDEHPEIKSAYIIKDNALAYTQATADYFSARFKELGGTICGQDAFVGAANVDLSSVVTRLRGKASSCDLVYDSSVIPAGAQLVRAIRDGGIETPIATNAGVNGTSVAQIAGKVSKLYAAGFDCVDSYCTGGSAGAKRVSADFKKAYGQAIGSSYALPGYDLANALTAAIEKAGSTDGAKIAAALYDGGLKVTLTSGKQAVFTSKCHRPQPATYSIEEFTGGKSKQVGEWSVKEIPDIGDANPCAGATPTP
jgi:branched-chain amino acid transport system substrate-binding protein